MRKWWARRGRRSKAVQAVNMARTRPPLREFVYLDDLSLRSLLASQKGEITDQVTDLLSQADEAELASTLGASSPILKAEVSARYQTTTSQGSQTFRKAVVQSLFKELRELDWIDVALSPQASVSDPSSVEDLVRLGLAVDAKDLNRGTLFEVEVELVADPIFRFSTIASELTEVAKDFPEVLDQPGAQEGMAALMTGNRFLQRFLAGLVPIRARSITSCRSRHQWGRTRCIGCRTANNLSLSSRPLAIVGVTEQASYWRDVRTVLFLIRHSRCFVALRRPDSGNPGNR